MVMIVDKICPNCEKKYQADTKRLKHGRQTTCSRKCSYEWRADKKRIHEVLSLTCPVCGYTFERLENGIVGKYGLAFCSPKCQYDARGLGITPRVVDKPYKIVPYDHTEAARKAWETRRKNGTDKHSEETKQKLADITARQIAEGKISRISSIEYIVKDKLIEHKINAIHQYQIRNPKTGRYVACCDFYLPDFNVVIEVNGTFWHADPRVYVDRNNLKPSQVRTLERYDRKMSVLDNIGIPVIEIWEKDIKENPDAFFVSVVEKLCA